MAADEVGNLPPDELKMIDALSQWIGQRTVGRSTMKEEHRTALSEYDRLTSKGQTFVKKQGRLPSTEELAAL